MKTNEFRKSTRQLLNTTTTKKPRQSQARKRLKTFADIKNCIDSPAHQSLFKSNRVTIIDRKMAKDHKKSCYHNPRDFKEEKDPVNYFQCYSKEIPSDVLETYLYDELFSLPCIKSVTSQSEPNIVISESYEFVEMNNNSIHVSRVFRSQMTNSFKTSINREDMINSKIKPVETQDNKENFRSDEHRILTLIKALKKNVQFSGLDTSKKHIMFKGLTGLEEILNSDEPFKGKYLSQESFGKYLHNRQLPNSIEAFKNIL